MKTIFETNRWVLFLEKGGSTTNGNGRIWWCLRLVKVCGTGDDGTRSNNIMAGVKN